MSEINQDNNKSSYTPEQLDKYKNIINFYKDYGSIFKAVYDNFYESSVNEDYYKAYHEIIKRTAALCDKFTLESYPLSIALIYEYLLWGGYLSKDHRYAYDTSNRVNNLACTGADIMRGHGVCLNHADMLANLYRELGYEAHMIGMSINSAIDKLDIWKPEIERKVDKNSKLMRWIGFTPLFQKFGNHAITIVKKDVYELFDPTSLAVLTPADVLKAKFVGTDVLFDLKAWDLLALEGLEESKEKSEVSNVTNVLFAQGVSNVNISLPLDEYKMVCTRIIEFLKQNENVLNEFYESNCKDIDIVCRTLTNERGKKRG